MACLAVRMKDARDERFLPLLAAIEREAADGRNYVKKALRELQGEAVRHELGL